MSTRAAAITALTFDLAGGAAREIQVLPAGAFRARDGRPTGVPAWYIGTALAAQLIARVHARKSPLVIDYEHQTLNAAKNGQPAPAAAWFSRLEWREGWGLWATDVEWTKRAAAMVAAKEYRFLSPVFAYDKATGNVVDLLHAAITNDPALDGMVDVAGRVGAHFVPQLQQNDMGVFNAPLSEMELAVCKRMGIKPEDYKTTKLADLADRSVVRFLDARTASLSEMELAVCKRMGIKPEDYKATKLAG